MLYSALLLVVYLLGSSVSFAFPKYLYPWTSTACILAALLAAPYIREMTTGEKAVCSGIAAVLTLFLIFFVGDTLYLATGYLKEAFAAEPAARMAAIHFVGVKLLLYFLSIPVVSSRSRSCARGVPRPGN